MTQFPLPSSSATRAIIAGFGLLLLSSTFVAQPADAYDFGCQNYWKGPSPDNEPLDCLKEFPKADFGMFVPPLIPTILTFILLVGFPLVFIGRILGACGSNQIRPGSDCCCDGEEWDAVGEEVKLSMYPKEFLSKMRIVVILGLCSTIICIVVVIYGAATSFASFDVMLKEAKKDILDWSDTMLATIEEQTRKPGGGYIPPITAETFVPFYDLRDWAVEIYTDVEDGYKNYGYGLRVGIYVAACVPTVAMAALLALSCFSIRRIVPRVLQFVYYVIGVLIGGISLVLLTLGIMGTCLCGEATLQQWQSPGFFQWYVVPECQSQSIFGDANALLRRMEVDNCIGACTELLKYCDAAADYDSGNVDVIFVCSLTSANVATECGSFFDANTIIENLAFKNGVHAATPDKCPSCTAMADCKDDCDTQELKDGVALIMELMGYAQSATVIIDKYLPELDCDVITTRFIGPLLEGEGKHCTDLAFGALVVGVGAAFATLVFIWAIILLFMGQKIWFSMKKVIYDDEDYLEVRSAHKAMKCKNPLQPTPTGSISVQGRR